jgi:hypothetical protein
VSDLSAADAERLVSGVLHRAEGAALPDLLEVLSGFDALPGSPYVVDQTPEELLAFMYQAWGRCRAAQVAGAPAIHIVACPKAGSAFTATAQALAFDIPVCSISAQQRWIFGPWLEFAARYPVAVHDHGSASPRAVELLRAANIRRLGLLVRDPRQQAISLAHHILKHPNLALQAHLAAYEAGGLAALIDVVIELETPNYVAWLKSWREHATGAGLQFHPLRFETLAREPALFFDGLGDVFDLTGDQRAALSIGVARAQALRADGHLNRRQEDTDEWRRVLSPTQLTALADRCADTFAGFYAF